MSFPIGAENHGRKGKPTEGSWKPGQSGNPKGRPKTPAWRRDKTFQKTAKEQAERHVTKAFKLLAQCVADQDAPMASRVSAANSILERAYGRAPQDVTIKGNIEHHIIKLIQGLDERVVDVTPDTPALPNGDAEQE